MSVIPISLTALPVPVGIKASNMNELLSLLAQYLEASIHDNVSFFLQGSNFPDSDQGIFYNQTIGKFGDWNAALGKYIPISDVAVGDIRASYVGGDDLVNGWVVMDGRLISAVPGLTQLQKSNLQTLFGGAASATVPNLPFLAGLQNPPANGSFANIAQPAVDPQKGYIGALAIDASYVQSQVAALRDAAEQLDDSVNSLDTTVSTMKGVAESLLNSLNASTASGTGPKNRVFVGYP